MRIQALGWSGFLLEEAGCRVAIDPQFSLWRDPGCLPPWDLHPLDLVVCSHGHADHAGDLPTLLRLHPRARFVASSPLAHRARTEWGLGDRAIAWAPREAVQIGGAEVLLIPGPHVGSARHLEQLATFLRRLGRRPRSALRLLRSHLQGEDGGGVHAIYVRMPGGASVLHAAETLHRGTDPEAFLRDGGSLALDTLLVGLEPGEECAALRLGALTRATTRIAFTPHAETRRHFGFDEARHGVDREAVRLAGYAWMEAGHELDTGDPGQPPPKHRPERGDLA